MMNEVVFTGDNDTLVKLIQNEGIRVIRASEMSNITVSKHSTVYIHFDSLSTGELLTEEPLHHLEWAKRKNIPCICLVKFINSKKLKQLYEMGFKKVLKETSFQTELINLLRDDNRAIPPSILANSPTYNQAATKLFSLVSKGVSSIHLTGETGVGKTHLIKVVTKAINPNKKIVSKNLSEYSPHLLESELFGHVKGAFTGALTDRQGIFEQACGGVLFLDEIATLPLQTQQKVLKVLEEKIVTPVGSNKPIQLDFQLVTATCENLERAVEKGTFREDLYYRLTMSSIEIPSIAQRAFEGELESILFTLQESSEHLVSFSCEAIKVLEENRWRGNFRDLQSLLCDLSFREVFYVKPEDLPAKYQQDSKTGEEQLLTPQQRNAIKITGLPEFIKRIEVELFKDAFESLGGRTNKICEDLKISKSVYYRISQAI